MNVAKLKQFFFQSKVGQLIGSLVARISFMWSY